MILDVIGDRLLESEPRPLITGGFYFLDVGLGEVLVLFADDLRHLDKLDLGGAGESCKHGVSEIDPGTGSSGADVKKTVCSWRHRQMNGHVDGIFHIQKIPLLLPVFE